jgi:hypothetical protein
MFFASRFGPEFIRMYYIDPTHRDRVGDRVDVMPGGRVKIGVAVPEPSAFCLGLIGVGIAVRKKMLAKRRVFLHKGT